MVALLQATAVWLHCYRVQLCDCHCYRVQLCDCIVTGYSCVIVIVTGYSCVIVIVTGYSCVIALLQGTAVWLHCYRVLLCDCIVTGYSRVIVLLQGTTVWGLVWRTTLLSTVLLVTTVWLGRYRPRNTLVLVSKSFVWSWHSVTTPFILFTCQARSTGLSWFFFESPSKELDIWFCFPARLKTVWLGLTGVCGWLAYTLECKSVGQGAISGYKRVKDHFSARASPVLCRFVCVCLTLIMCIACTKIIAHPTSIFWQEKAESQVPRKHQITLTAG